MLAVLLQKTIERAAPGTAIQPDDNLITGRRVLGRKEPEPERILTCRVAVNGQGAGVRLADVKVDVGNGRAVYREL